MISTQELDEQLAQIEIEEKELNEQMAQLRKEEKEVQEQIDQLLEKQKIVQERRQKKEKWHTLIKDQNTLESDCDYVYLENKQFEYENNQANSELLKEKQRRIEEKSAQKNEKNGQITQNPKSSPEDHKNAKTSHGKPQRKKGQHKTSSLGVFGSRTNVNNELVRDGFDQMEIADEIRKDFAQKRERENYDPYAGKLFNRDRRNLAALDDMINARNPVNNRPKGM